MKDQDFAQLYQTVGPTQLAKRLGIAVRNVFMRKARVEQRLGVTLQPPEREKATGLDTPTPDVPREEFEIKNGVVLVGGDGHYWPGQDPTAHRALCKLAKELKPKAVIFNGDALDAPSISRHPPIGWEDHPTLQEELEVVQERLGEIENASGSAQLFWPLGNHDARFNTRLAAVAPEFRGLPGTRLVHHFPAWTPCWAVFLGGHNGAVVKHRFKGGMHAAHNNALWAGRSIITGHLHSLKVSPITDYNGTRYGVDAGCIAAVGGPQFGYAEQNPHNWRSGFAVLTWKDGKLLPPELVEVLDEEVGQYWFRGKLYKA
jgi:hypothetical protein